VGALVGADSSNCDCAATSRQRCFLSWRDRVVDRRNEPMELRSAWDRIATAHHHPLFCSSCCGFRLRRSVCAQFHSPRIALPRLACFSRLLGGVRISYRDGVASQHMGQSRLHTNELSPRNPDRLCHRHLGDQLRRVSVCRNDRSSIERRRTGVATACAGYYC
jgi:hypothetical protein